jgi:hypothetical protein
MLSNVAWVANGTGYSLVHTDYSTTGFDLDLFQAGEWVNIDKGRRYRVVSVQLQCSREREAIPFRPVSAQAGILAA